MYTCRIIGADITRQNPNSSRVVVALPSFCERPVIVGSYECPSECISQGEFVAMFTSRKTFLS